MRRKLTVTVDEEILPRAKRFARSRGTSLSRLIEETLRDLSRSPTVSFSRRWRGAFQPAGRSDARYRRLARKYL